MPKYPIINGKVSNNTFPIPIPTDFLPVYTTF